MWNLCWSYTSSLAHICDHFACTCTYTRKSFLKKGRKLTSNGSLTIFSPFPQAYLNSFYIILTLMTHVWVVLWYLAFRGTCKESRIYGWPNGGVGICKVDCPSLRPPFNAGNSITDSKGSRSHVSGSICKVYIWPPSTYWASLSPSNYFQHSNHRMDTLLCSIRRTSVYNKDNFDNNF